MYTFFFEVHAHIEFLLGQLIVIDRIWILIITNCEILSVLNNKDGDLNY